MLIMPIFRKLFKFIDRIQEGAPRVKKTQTKAPAAKQEPYVYVTAGGKKFHYDRLCPGIRNAKEIKMDLSKARKAGYTACDKCCWDYLHK